MSKIKKENIIIAFILIIYSVGLIGLSIPEYSDYFLSLTPLNLLLTLGVFLVLNNRFNIKVFSLMLIIFCIGFGVEVAGVATGELFGSYQYGEPLGLKKWNVPLIIGVNWLFLSFSSYGIIRSLTKNKMLLIILPAALMTSLDFLVEPVAVNLDFWSWTGNTIPVQNYVMWFITAAIIHTIITYSKPIIKAKPSYLIFGIQVIFFTILNLTL